jgi:hypothetical protein
MTTMNAQETQELIQAIKQVGQKLRVDTVFRDKFFSGVDQRVLTEQPEQTPKQRSERLLSKA